MRTWQTKAKSSVKFWPADRCSRKRGVSMRTGDRPTTPLPSLPTLFPIPAIPSCKCQAFAQASSPDALGCRVLSRRLSVRECSVGKPGTVWHLSFQAQSSQHPFCHLVARSSSSHIPVPSNRTQDRTKKRHRLLTGWVWVWFPRAGLTSW